MISFKHLTFLSKSMPSIWHFYIIKLYNMNTHWYFWSVSSLKTYLEPLVFTDHAHLSDPAYLVHFPYKSSKLIHFLMTDVLVLSWSVLVQCTGPTSVLYHPHDHPVRDTGGQEWVQTGKEPGHVAGTVQRFGARREQRVLHGVQHRGEVLLSCLGHGV